VPTAPDTPFQIRAPRVLAAEATLGSGALHRAIFESTNYLSIATDGSGVILSFNCGAQRMLGYTADEVVGLMTPADLADSKELLTRARWLGDGSASALDSGFEVLVYNARRGIEDSFQLTFIRKDGGLLPAALSVTRLRDDEGAGIGFLLTATDNSGRRQIDEERTQLDQRLRNQNLYTRSLVESNVDAVITTDSRGTITDVNRHTEELTGRTRLQLIGTPFKDYFTDTERAEDGIKQVLSETRVNNYELSLLHADGSPTVVSYNAATFYDHDGVLQGVFAAARDMTELKGIEFTLRQQNVELEEASRIKSEFLATMSHELRTPLNAIIGFSEVLRDGLMGDLTDPQRGFLSDIFDSGTHLLSLINDILDLSKVEAGKMQLDVEPALLSSLFGNSISIIREKAAERRVHLVLDAPDSLGVIQADGRKIKQILYNLLSNAVKFTNEGGQVTLSAAEVPRSQVGLMSGDPEWSGRTFPLVASDFEDFLRITVADTGMGIPKEGLARLFQPFSQVDSGLDRKFEGTGLGLAMVKLLTELHCGAVGMESAVGQGSRFSVWIPLRAPEGGLVMVPRLVPDELGEPLTGVRTALIVEDDMKSAELIRIQLEAEGFVVLHAMTAEAGLLMAMQQPLSLITLDIMLPNMDGWEFLSRVKLIPELRRIPVVIISIVADVERGFSLGASAVMQKPISRQELYESLVDLGLFPVSEGRALKVLIVDDDPKAVELIAIRILGLASSVIRAYGGADAIEVARRELPDLIILDLMMPEVSGFDVVTALNNGPVTALIPILIVTAKQITAEDRTRLTGGVTTVMQKAEFDRTRFKTEVRRAMSGRPLVS